MAAECRMFDGDGGSAHNYAVGSSMSCLFLGPPPIGFHVFFGLV